MINQGENNFTIPGTDTIMNIGLTGSNYNITVTGVSYQTVTGATGQVICSTLPNNGIDSCGNCPTIVCSGYNRALDISLAVIVTIVVLGLIIGIIYLAVENQKLVKKIVKIR